MIPITQEDCFHFGTLIKTHGTSGGYIASLKVEVNARFKKLESLFLLIDGFLVPFFIAPKGITFPSRFTALLQFNEITNVSQAQEFVHCDIFADSKFFEKNQLIDFTKFIGYSIIQEDHSVVGNITSIIENPNNPVAVVKNKNREILIPLHHKILFKVDVEKEEILVRLPDGLLELYQ